jgi:TonB family protein
MFRCVGILFLLCLFGFNAFAQTAVNKPLLILSNPRPVYTNAARKNNIQGSVQVRVTFLAKGKIGAVIDELTNDEDLRIYGLVKAAMEAAKKIKFEPEIKNGKPVRTTKILTYTFTLY